MVGISIFTAVAVVAAGIAGVQGMYVQQERYPVYYGKGVSARNFWTDANPVLRAHPETRVPALEPTVATVTLLDRIDFRKRAMPVETRIFTGTLDVSDCYEGKYLFRLTSDDASHMFIEGKMLIDNGGEHGSVTKTATVTLERGKQYDMQLWWGNYGGPATAKLEYCLVSGAVDAPEDGDESGLLSAIRGIARGVVSEVLDAAMDAELAAHGCVFTTDLSSIFVKHEVPTIKRQDFAGYYWGNLNFFNTAKVETKWLPSGFGAETGGVIAAHARDKGPETSQFKSFIFSTPIAARTTGVHTFWVESDDGAFLYIDDVKVVDSQGGQGLRWRRGAVHLKAGERKVLKVYYGNASCSGKLDVRWQDDIEEEPLKSFQPIMVV